MISRRYDLILIGLGCGWGIERMFGPLLANIDDESADLFIRKDFAESGHAPSEITMENLLGDGFVAAIVSPLVVEHAGSDATGEVVAVATGAIGLIHLCRTAAGFVATRDR